MRIRRIDIDKAYQIKYRRTMETHRKRKENIGPTMNYTRLDNFIADCGDWSIGGLHSHRADAS